MWVWQGFAWSLKVKAAGAWEGLALRWEGGGEAVQGQNRLPRRAGPAHRFQGAIGKAPLEEGAFLVN